MKIVSENHADTLRRPGAGDRSDAALVDMVGDDLRALYGDEAADLPEALVALAARLDAAGKGVAGKSAAGRTVSGERAARAA